MNDKEATKMEVGEDDVGERLIPHTFELTPDKAEQLGKKLQRYAEIARSIAKEPRG